MKLTWSIASVFDRCVMLFRLHRGTGQVHQGVWTGVRTSSHADHQEADQQNGNDGEVLHLERFNEFF